MLPWIEWQQRTDPEATQNGQRTKMLDMCVRQWVSEETLFSYAKKMVNAQGLQKQCDPSVLKVLMDLQMSLEEAVKDNTGSEKSDDNSEVNQAIKTIKH